MDISSEPKELRSIMELGINEGIHSTLEHLRKEEDSKGEWYKGIVLDYLYNDFKKVVAGDYNEYKESQEKKNPIN